MNVHGGCSKGPCKEESIENILPKKGILTKQGTYIMAILGTDMLNNYHILFVKPWMHIHEEWHRQQQQ